VKIIVSEMFRKEKCHLESDYNFISFYLTPKLEGVIASTVTKKKAPYLQKLGVCIIGFLNTLTLHCSSFPFYHKLLISLFKEIIQLFIISDMGIQLDSPVKKDQQNKSVERRKNKCD
jgi:hypothetical protein